MSATAAVRERPLLFSGEMVRALLAGRKTETRRVVTREWPHMFHGKAAPLARANGRDDFVTFSEPYTSMVGEPVWFYSWGNARWLRCPFGSPGSRLWVRETWAPNEGTAGGIVYRADYADACVGTYRANLRSGEWETAVSRWRSPILMPRWASRLTLEIDEVRVERLQEITEEGARAEGMIRSLHYGKAGICRSAKEAFMRGWDALHAKRPERQWSASPWVWVLRFHVIPQEVAGG